MKFNTLGKAVRTLQDIGLDDIDIAILHVVSYNSDVTVNDVVFDCSDIASAPTIRAHLKKVMQAKLLKLEENDVDKRVKNVTKGSKFSELEAILGGL